MSKISQAAAADAAKKITEPIRKQIEALNDSLRVELGTIVRKSIPKEVLALFETHQNYVKSGTSFRVYGNGFNGQYLPTDKRYPETGNNDTVTPTKEEAKKLQDIISKKEKLSEQLQTTRTEIEKTIISLGTYNRVKEQFPEAYPYLPQATTNTSLIVEMKPIRDKVKKLVA